MQFGFLGLSYKTAGLDVRDKTAFTDHAKMDFMQELEAYDIKQCVIVSTCNRSEVYYLFEKEWQSQELVKLYMRTFSQVDLLGHLKTSFEEEAMRHLYLVTAGLESQILGEDQILGQVKDAVDFSRTMGYCKKEIEKIFREAVTCAKRIKTEVKISQIPLSVGYVGVRQLEACSPIRGKRVLVIGSGKMSNLAIQYIKDYGADRILLCSRTLAHANALKRESDNIEIIAYEDRYEALKSCHILISATSSPHIIIKKSKIVLEHETYMLDLATPRDIDDDFSKDPLCHLINLDAVQEMVLSNQREREDLVQKGVALIEESLQEIRQWLLSSHMDETIQSLQQRCQEIVEDSYHYLENKLELSHREKTLLKRTLNASLQRLIKEPIHELKHLETEEEQEAYKLFVHKLFQIEDGKVTSK